MRLYLVIFLIFLLLIFKLVSNINALNASTEDISLRYEVLPSRVSLFPIQCIDTMKVSRDRAREKMIEAEQKAVIATSVKTISSIGANCIALGTPYNDEFLPFLKLWVSEARKQHLHVWFRGNWAEWEGWFGYPKNLTVTEHIKKTKEFIQKNPDLFEDGDIFTPAPEPENGGPFDPVDSHTKTDLMRQFLIAGYIESARSFEEIGKRVTTNWLSMSGGVAKAIMNHETIYQLGNTVTLDHYVENPSEMEEYVSYFSDRYNAGIVLGEFGAPIPDLNGSMSDKEQAVFVEKLLHELYEEGTVIKGVNYWSLSESSSSLLNKKGQEKEVVATLKKYYLPAVVSGKVRDVFGNSIKSLSIHTQGSARNTVLDSHGQFSFVIPAKTTKFIIDETREYEGKVFTVSVQPGQSVFADITLRPQNSTFMYRVKSSLKKLIQ